MTDATITNPFYKFTPEASSDAEHNFGGSRLLFREAAYQFGVDLTPREDSEWRPLLGGAYLVDHLIDVEKLDIMPPIYDILAGKIRGDLGAGIQSRLREYMLKQPPKRTEEILNNVRRVNSLAIAQRESTTAEDVIEIRVQEADILAHLLSLPTDDKQDFNERHKFNNWLKSWSRTGYLLDSLLDMQSDYDNGESGVKPTLKSRLTIGAAFANEVTTAAKRTPQRLMGKCAVSAARYLVLNKKLDMTSPQ